MNQPALASLPFADLLKTIAAKTPTPGGGAVACAAGALSAATAGMVVAYSLGKKDLAPHQEALKAAETYLARARALFLRLADEDGAAYGLLNELQRLPETDPRRQSELPGAALASVQVPLASVAACADMLALLASLVGASNRHLRSDLEVAAILAEAAARSGACNVRINLPSLPEGERGPKEGEVAALLERCAGLMARVLAG